MAIFLLCGVVFGGVVAWRVCAARVQQRERVAFEAGFLAGRADALAPPQRTTGARLHLVGGAPK